MPKKNNATPTPKISHIAMKIVDMPPDWVLMMFWKSAESMRTQIERPRRAMPAMVTTMLKRISKYLRHDVPQPIFSIFIDRLSFFYSNSYYYIILNSYSILSFSSFYLLFLFNFELYFSIIFSLTIFTVSAALLFKISNEFISGTNDDKIFDGLNQ